jgi:hypothetical protein
VCAGKIQDFDLRGKKIRLIGAGVSNLSDSSIQPSLFESTPTHLGKKEKLHQALGEIKEKFGEKAIKHRDTR